MVDRVFVDHDAWLTRVESADGVLHSGYAPSGVVIPVPHAVLGTLLEDSKWVGNATDQICYYRNLAIRLGAKPDDMCTTHDRQVCENWSTYADDDGTTVTERVDMQRREWAEIWDTLHDLEVWVDEQIGFGSNRVMSASQAFKAVKAKIRGT